MSDVVTESEELVHAETNVNVPRNSPLAVFFRRAISSDRERTDSDNTNDSMKSNTLYSPKCFKVMSDLMAFFPMWSCILTSPVVSNAVVECHFKQLKTTTLKIRFQRRPADVVNSERVYVRSQLNSVGSRITSANRVKGNAEKLGDDHE